MLKTLLMCCIIFIIACKKKHLQVEGVVYDYYTKQPAKDIKLSMNKYKPGGGIPGFDFSSTKNIKNLTSDGNGNFQIDYKGDSKNISVIAESFGYEGVVTGDTTNQISNLKDGYNYVTLSVRQKGRFILKLHNIAPFDNNDLIKLSWSYVSTVDGSELPAGNRFYGFVNQSYELVTVANIEKQISYEVTKNGIKQAKKDTSIYAPVDGPLPTLEIKY